MTYREMNLAVFQGLPTPHVLFQPRIEPWFAWHRTFGKVPARYQSMSLLELFDDLDVSMRYLQYYTGLPGPTSQGFDEAVTVHEERSSTRLVRAYDTPLGQLVERHEKTIDATWREVEFPVKTREDLARLRWLMQHTRHGFDVRAVEVGQAYLGERGVA